MQGGWTNTDNDWQLKRLQLDSVRMVEKIVDLIRENVERDVITHGQEYERLFGKSSAQFSELLTMVVEKLEQEGVTPPALISWLKEAAMQDSLPAASDLRDSQSATLSFLERVIPDGERLQLSQEFSPAEPSHEEPTIPVTRSDAQTASSTQLNALGQLSPPRSLNSALGAGQSQRLSGPHNAVNGQSSSGPHSVVSAWDYQDESEEAQPTSSAPSFASMPAPAAAEPATMPSTNPLTPESGAAPASAFSAPLPPVQNPLPQPQQAYQAAPVINGSQWENLQSAPLPQSFASSPIAPPAVPVAQSVAPPVAPQPVAPQPVAPQPVAPQPVAPQAVAEQAPLPVRPSSSHFQLPPLPPLPAASSLPLPQYTPPAAPVAPALPVEPVKTLVQPADQVESPWAAPPFPIPSPVFTPNLQTPPVPYTPSAYAPAPAPAPAPVAVAPALAQSPPQPLPYQMPTPAAAPAPGLAPPGGWHGPTQAPPAAPAPAQAPAKTFTGGWSSPPSNQTPAAGGGWQSQPQTPQPAPSQPHSFPQLPSQFSHGQQQAQQQIHPLQHLQQAGGQAQPNWASPQPPAPGNNQVKKEQEDPSYNPSTAWD